MGDVNTKDSDESTPLHVAAHSGNSKVVKMLIDAGADVRAVDDEGLTPLHWATETGNLKILKLLIDSGSDVNASSDVHWKTAPHSLWI